jgi:hypothetical protein
VETENKTDHFLALVLHPIIVHHYAVTTSSISSWLRIYVSIGNSLFTFQTSTHGPEQQPPRLDGLLFYCHLAGSPARSSQAYLIPTTTITTELNHPRWHQLP